MTQEELDALMAGDLDEDMTVLDDIDVEKSTDENTHDLKTIDEENYRVTADGEWPPPPPTEDHRVVNQLDDVTKDSEKKATEIMDKLEEINNFVMDTEEEANSLVAIMEKNIETFEKLSQKFPNIALFTASLDENKNALEKLNGIVQKSQESEDEIMLIMDIMQYQDIHRQKIERVINVMRALSKYMNSLFASDIDDEKRVSSAVHIEGDKDNEDLVDNAEIEALLASFEQK